MVRRSSILGFAVALSLIAAIAYFARPVNGVIAESFAMAYLLILIFIIPVIIGGAIARSGKAGGIVGFLAVWIPSFFGVWIPTFEAPLFLFLGFASVIPDAGLAGLLVVFSAIGLMIVSFVLGALGALIGGIAGYLSGRTWPVDVKA